MEARLAMMAPILFQWDGEAMVPANAFWRRKADETFAIGERHPLVIQEERSQISHAHYFASVAEVWKNLGEDQSAHFPTSEHLRKWALIRCGYRDERSITCASKAEALRVAAFVKPMDDFAVVTTAGATVVVLTAKSQSYRAMGKREFGESKNAVLDFLWAMIGVQPETGAREAGMAA